MTPKGKYCQSWCCHLKYPSLCLQCWNKRQIKRNLHWPKRHLPIQQKRNSRTKLQCQNNCWVKNWKGLHFETWLWYLQPTLQSIWIKSDSHHCPMLQMPKVWTSIFWMQGSGLNMPKMWRAAQTFWVQSYQRQCQVLKLLWQPRLQLQGLSCIQRRAKKCKSNRGQDSPGQQGKSICISGSFIKSEAK